MCFAGGALGCSAILMAGRWVILRGREIADSKRCGSWTRLHSPWATGRWPAMAGVRRNDRRAERLLSSRNRFVGCGLMNYQPQRGWQMWPVQVASTPWVTYTDALPLNCLNTSVAGGGLLPRFSSSLNAQPAVSSMWSESMNPKPRQNYWLYSNRQ